MTGYACERTIRDKFTFVDGSMADDDYLSITIHHTGKTERGQAVTVTGTVYVERGGTR